LRGSEAARQAAKEVSAELGAATLASEVDVTDRDAVDDAVRAVHAKVLRSWRARIAARAEWKAAIADPTAA
jgi:hypothetical protein